MKKSLKFPYQRYKIQKKLGEGGLGEVYKAYDLWEEKEVALKLLLDQGHLKKFQKEFQLMTQLDYPGLVQAFDFGYTYEDKKPYFTMELVEGPHLSQLDLKKDLKKLYQIALKVVVIMDYIHSQGIIHCDLKPDNFRLTQDPIGVKLLDFGLAEKMGASTKSKPKGTLSYMAPELLKNKKIDERADFYSLGIMLYELITERLPFLEEDPIKLLSAHLEEKPLAPLKLNPRIPSSLNHLVLKLLEKSPQDRPSSSQLKKTLYSLWGKESKSEDKNIYLNYLSGGIMVGRENELESLLKNLEKATHHQGKIVLIQGELGTGKSLLVKNFKVKAQLQGILFVDSRCYGKESSPYHPIKKILLKLIPYLTEKSPYLLEEFDQELKLLLSQGSRNSTIKSKDLSMEEENLSSRMALFLVKASQVLPFCLCLEDLHWAPAGSLKILEKLASLITESKMLLCGSIRDEELNPEGQLKGVINVLTGKDYFQSIKLSRFTSKELKDLLRSKLSRIEPPQELITYVYKTTSGNPFFTIEVLKFLLEKGILSIDRRKLKIDTPMLNSISVPDHIEKIWMENLEKYDDSIQNFLQVSALAGKEFDLEIIKFLSGYSENKIFDILFTLLRDQVFTQRKKEKDKNLWYEFINQSLKHLLYERLPEKKSIFLHKKLGEFLEKRRGWDPQEKAENIAYHFIRSNDYEKAFQYSMICAEKASRQFAHHEIENYLKSALEASFKFEDKREGVKRRLMVLMRRGDLWKGTGELNSALKDYGESLRLARLLKDLPGEAKSQRELGEIYRLKHDYKGGLKHLNKALETYKKINDTNGIASTLNNLGNLYWIDSQYDQAKESYQIAFELHRKLGNKELAALSLNNMGIISSIQYKYNEALQYFNQALAIQRELDKKEEIARGLNNVGAVMVLSSKYNQAIGSFQEAFKLNEKIGNKKEMCFNLENLGAAFLKLGDYRKALKYSRRGLKLSKEIDFQQRMGWIKKDLGIINLEMGFYQKAKRCLDKSLRISRNIGDKELRTVALTSLAKLFYLLNSIPKALNLLGKAKKSIQEIDDKRSLISVHQLEGLIQLRGETPKKTLALFNKGLKIAEDLKAKEEKLSLNLDIGKIYLDLEDMEKASHHLNQAKKLFDENQSPVYQPELYVNLARLNWMRNEKKPAEKLFFTALDKALNLNRSEMVWKIHHLLGKLYLTSYEIEKAYKELEKAGMVLRKISDEI
ncbi:MAG: BREX system ATP-binding domain-containing protein, partial [Candidatus Zixiibacteriota bacterium]